MANQLAPTARVAFASGLIDWTAIATWSIVAVDQTYVFNAAHDFLSDVGAGMRLGDSVLTSRVVLADGAVDADDVGIAATDGLTYAGLWIYIDTGVDATSQLVAWFDTWSDDTPLTGVVTGSSISVVWPVAGIFRL